MMNNNAMLIHLQSAQSCSFILRQWLSLCFKYPFVIMNGEHSLSFAIIKHKRLDGLLCVLLLVASVIGGLLCPYSGLFRAQTTLIKWESFVASRHSPIGSVSISLLKGRVFASDWRWNLDFTSLYSNSRQSMFRILSLESCYESKQWRHSYTLLTSLYHHWYLSSYSRNISKHCKCSLMTMHHCSSLANSRMAGILLSTPHHSYPQLMD